MMVSLYTSYHWQNSYRSWPVHYNDVMMSAKSSQIIRLMIVYSIVYSGADWIKYQSSASVAFVRGIHRWPVKSTHKGPVTRKMFPFDDVIMRSHGREIHSAIFNDIVLSIDRFTGNHCLSKKCNICMYSSMPADGLAFTVVTIKVTSHWQWGVANRRQFRCLFRR